MQSLNCFLALNHIILDFSGFLILTCTTSDFRNDDSNGAFGCGSVVSYCKMDIYEHDVCQGDNLRRIYGNT